MPDPTLCSEDEIRTLVHTFYAEVQRDALLGPIFASRVQDWDVHLAKMVDFWSSVLRGTARFRGAPMPRHAALPDLSEALFQHWLALFHRCTASQPNQAMAERANLLSQRIAESLWYGYQLSHSSEALPASMRHG